MSDLVKHVGDGAAVVTTVASVLGWLPAVVTIVSGLLTIVWLIIRIAQMLVPKRYESFRQHIDKE